MARGIRKGDYVKVIWVDSSSTNRWEAIEAAQNLTVMDCTTVGHLLNRNGNAVRVVQTTDPDGVVIQAIAIPKVCVISITRLIEAPE